MSEIVMGASLDRDRRSLAERRVEAARRQPWLEARAKDFERIDERRLADRATGKLFQVVDRDVFGLGSIPIDLDARPDFVWWPTETGPLILEPVSHPPFSVLEMRAAAAEAQRVWQAQEDGYDLHLAAQPKRAVTLADVTGRRLPTVRAAAQAIADLHGEIVSTPDGRLEVRVPQELSRPDTLNRADQERELLRRVVDATRVLVAARSVVLEALADAKAKGPLAEQLPDAPVGADGGIVQ